MKNGKRILSVTVKRVIDDSPDTSWLGEYSNTRTSEFSIDRKHDENCASVSPVAAQAKTTLDRAAEHVNALRADGDEDSPEDFILQEAIAQITDIAEQVTECDCGEHGDMGRHEYRYFNPSVNYVDRDGRAPGNIPDEVRKYVRQDYEQMESFNRGDWCFIGIAAEASIGIRDGLDDNVWYTTQTIHSGGLWGIESDSEASYIESEEQNQLAELKDQLLALGFSKRAIATAFKDVKHKDE